MVWKSNRPFQLWASVCAVIVLSSTLSHGQQSHQAPTFTGGIDLVTVDVSVLDADGRPVLGLGADDFEIRLDGKVRPVRVLTLVEANPAGVEALPAVSSETVVPGARRVFANDAPPTAEARLIIFMVDDLSFSFARGKELFVAAERLIKALPPGDVVGFTTASGGQVINPTTDHQAVLIHHWRKPVV